MNTVKQFGGALLGAALSAALAVPALAGSKVDPDAFQAAWQAADDARQQAASLGHEWRDTAKMLQQAKELADGGELAQAMALVEHAKMEGERAAEQAQQQAKLWQDAVPK